MKIVYMGTPDFAVPTLQMLLQSGHEIGYVLTQPDKAKDRGKKVQMPPVKEEAVSHSITVLQPERLSKDDEVIRLLTEYEPDLIVVAAYGQILPKRVLDIPRAGCINIHGSILPKYRGAAPIQWAMMDGQERTGITLMKMDVGLDTGDMLATAETAIDHKTFAELHDELAQMGANLLSENLEAILSLELKGERQDDALSTYAPMIFKKDAVLDFSKSAVVLERMIRALSTSPVAHTLLDGETMKVYRAKALETSWEKEPGTIVAATKNGIEVATGAGSLLIEEIQLPGKRKMSVALYLVGKSIEIGTKLG